MSHGVWCVRGYGVGSDKMGYWKLLLGTVPVVLKTFPSLATSSLLNSGCGS